MMADQRAREDSSRPPVQDLNNEDDPAAELGKLLKQNPDALAQMLENLRHLRVINGTGMPAPSRGNKLQIITSASQALASGGFTWARFVFIYLLTALSDAIKMEGEIPKEQREEFDVMKRNLEGKEMKLRKVEQDVGNLKETVRLLALLLLLYNASAGYRYCCCRSEPECLSIYVYNLLIAYLFHFQFSRATSVVHIDQLKECDCLPVLFSSLVEC